MTCSESERFFQVEVFHFLLATKKTLVLWVRSPKMNFFYATSSSGQVGGPSQGSAATPNGISSSLKRIRINGQQPATGDKEASERNEISEREIRFLSLAFGNLKVTGNQVRLDSTWWPRRRQRHQNSFRRPWVFHLVSYNRFKFCWCRWPSHQGFQMWREPDDWEGGGNGKGPAHWPHHHLYKAPRYKELCSVPLTLPSYLLENIRYLFKVSFNWHFIYHISS